MLQFGKIWQLLRKASVIFSVMSLAEMWGSFKNVGSAAQGLWGAYTSPGRIIQHSFAPASWGRYRNSHLRAFGKNLGKVGAGAFGWAGSIMTGLWLYDAIMQHGRDTKLAKSLKQIPNYDLSNHITRELHEWSKMWGCSPEFVLSRWFNMKSILNLPYAYLSYFDGEYGETEAVFFGYFSAGADLISSYGSDHFVKDAEALADLEEKQKKKTSFFSLGEFSSDSGDDNAKGTDKEKASILDYF